jgi:signal transduction histidine kinase
LLPVTSDNGGLTFALRALADRSRDLYGIRVDFRSEVSADLPMSEGNASHLYRIAQEALTNTARHGHATAVEVLLRVSAQDFMLQISDDGVGTADLGREVTGMGLKIMRYRASMIGARFEMVANRPRGTVVRVSGEQSMWMSALQSSNVI